MAGVRSLLSAVAAVQSRLGCRSWWVTPARRVVLPPLDPIARRFYDRPLIRHKGVRDYVCTTELPPRDVECAVAGKYHRNVLATKKYRTLADGDRQWEVGSWRRVAPDNRRYQGHLYLFPSTAVDGGTDLHHHREVNYLVDPEGHEHEDQQHGDPKGSLRDALDAADVPFKRV